MAEPARAWQLEMFERSLKKRQKLRALLRLNGRPEATEECLLLTCGDNNGALNYHFRASGGRWLWGDVAGQNLAEMAAFLGEPVLTIAEHDFPFADGRFSRVIAIDVLEHLAADRPFLQEVRRVLQPGGRAVVTTPNGDPALLANRVKRRLGMTPAIYGHTRAGYTAAELSRAVAEAGLEPMARAGYSGFFTEMVELGVNYGYVFMLGRKKGPRPSGHIAPTTAGELKQHGLAYRLYSLAFPFMRLLSKLDRLLPAGGDGAVIVVGRKALS
jgi:SAM-dependent methyltransferase